MATPDLRKACEDKIESLLSDLKSSNGGYLRALEIYYGSLDPDGDDHRLVNTLNRRAPAVLLRTGDGEYRRHSRDRTLADHSFEIEILILSKNFRSVEARHRGDGSDPGIYQIMLDIRDRLMGVDLDTSGLGLLTPSDERVALRMEDRTIWLVTYGIDADAEAVETTEEYTDIRSEVNEPDDEDANPILEFDTEL